MKKETSPSSQAIARAYIRLVLGIDRHYPGYVDGYYGPAEWKRLVDEGEPPALPDLLRAARDLEQAAAAAPELGEGRQDYLVHEARAAQTTIRILQGEPLSLSEEVEGVYDLQIAWIEEQRFEQLRRKISELLPGAGELTERYADMERRLETPAERIQPLASYAIAELQRRAASLFRLPPEDGVELIFKDAAEPWAGYHEYLGNHRSRVAVNTHYPQRLSNFIHILAHEAYPGHHTEHSLKEMRLRAGTGGEEHYIIMANSPSCVISEGAAMLALETAFPDAELADWFEQEIYPRAGLKNLDARRQIEIARAARQMEALFGNAVILMYDRNASDEEVFAYMRRYSTELDENLRAMVDFMRDRVRRAYTFCYTCGTRLMDDLFDAHPDRVAWHLRAISEATTPSLLRRWIAAAPSSSPSC